MPHLRFRSLTSAMVEQLSKDLPQPLAQCMGTTVDNFTFELIATQFFENGHGVTSYPFVEVLWFQRSQEVQDTAAQLITEAIKKSVANDVVVVFIDLAKQNYYENAKHF